MGILFYVFVAMPACMSVYHMHEVPEEPEETLDLLELELEL